MYDNDMREIIMNRECTTHSTSKHSIISKCMEVHRLHIITDIPCRDQGEHFLLLTPNVFKADLQLLIFIILLLPCPPMLLLLLPSPLSLPLLLLYSYTLLLLPLRGFNFLLLLLVSLFTIEFSLCMLIVYSGSLVSSYFNM